jgi:hypothetical protein
MPPEARKLAKLVGELESVARRLKGLVPLVQSFEMWERAEKKRQAVFGRQPADKA